MTRKKITSISHTVTETIFFQSDFTTWTNYRMFVCHTEVHVSGFLMTDLQRKFSHQA